MRKLGWDPWVLPVPASDLAQVGHRPHKALVLTSVAAALLSVQSPASDKKLGVTGWEWGLGRELPARRQPKSVP